MATISGGCQCGGLRYQITAPPGMTYTCHCVDCQRMTSGAFSMAIVVPDAAFRIVKGELRAIQRLADSGRTTNRWVCVDCGCWICSGPKPGLETPYGLRIVRAGTLDDTSSLHPTVHFWTRSKQRWIELPAGGQLFETQPADIVAFMASEMPVS
jgi:hypothetical protein